MKYLLEYNEWLESLNEMFMIKLITVTNNFMGHDILSFNINKNRYAYSINNTTMKKFKSELKKKFGHRNALAYVEQHADKAWKLTSDGWHIMNRLGKTWRMGNEIDHNFGNFLKKVIK